MYQHFNYQRKQFISSLLDDGQIFYQALRDIQIGEELLVYYGDQYADYLGINTSQLFEYTQHVHKTFL